MTRKPIALGSIVVLVGCLLAAIAPVSAVEADGQPRDENRFVNLNTYPQWADPANPTPAEVKAFKNVAPDEVSTVNGARVELYTSMGDLEGGMDWRTVNVFSYLVNSVPKNKHSYTALFNSLYDGKAVGYTGGKFTLATMNEAYAPTAAYYNLLNRYDTAAERGQYIHILGAKQSMDEAYAAKSSLARLVMHSSNKGAGVYNECKYGNGGCLTSPYNKSALMHAKYGAFEQAADSTGTIRDHVVFITSSNLNGASGSKKSNTSIVVYGDETLYNDLVNDIYKSEVGAKNDNKNGKNYMTSGYKNAIKVSGGTIPGFFSNISGTTLYPSPRATTEINGGTTLMDQTDVEAKFLKQQADSGNGSSSMAGCRAYVIHSLFNSTRSGVFDALAKLESRNCDVRVILGTNAISDVVDGYFTMSTDLRQVIDRVEFANVHDKSISYSYGSTKTMFGGSTNLTGTSMNYDELAFRIDDSKIVDAKQAHDERIYSTARGNVKWTNPSSVAIEPSTIKVKTGDTVQLNAKVSPSNALVTNTTWSVTSGNEVVSVNSSTGVVTGLQAGSATVKVSVDSPNLSAPKTTTKSITVSASGSSTADAVKTVTAAPSLTMERYQGPKNSKTKAGTIETVVTWGSAGEDYTGKVKLQYYKGGWKTYKTVTVTKGVFRADYGFANSKTWRAVGSSVSTVYDSETGKSMKGKLSGSPVSEGYSYVTVRTKKHSTTPRLYATTMAKKGKIPFGLSYKKSSDTIKLQYKSGTKWKTKATIKYKGDWDMFLGTAESTRSWRVVTSSGKRSNTVKVVVK